MSKYLSIICAFLGILIFTTQFLPFSSWIALLLTFAGSLLGLSNIKQENNSTGKFAFIVNIATFTVLILGLLVRVFIWNRP
jgi:hypothetical protein